MNYTELKSNVADWLNRSDLTSVIPTFIELAEAKFQRYIRHYYMIQRSTQQISVEYIDLPTDWLQTIRVVCDGTALEMADPKSMEPPVTVTSAKPTHYRHSGDTFQFFPAPDKEYTFTMEYFKKIPALSDSNLTNWLIDEYPDAYLYGALVEAVPYLADDSRLPIWAGALSQTMQAINAESEAARFSGPLRLIR